MLAITQLITVIAMIAATFVVYKAFGSRGDSFVYTREEKKSWDRIISQSVGSWFTATNIAATLTSLATVYIFFIGNTKLFGFVIFITVFTIWGGAFVTNYFTKVLSSRAPYRHLLESGDPAAGIIAAIFWKPQPADRQTSSIIRYVSLVNISCIIWLEFSVFSDISGQLVAEGDLTISCVLMFVTTATIAYFTVQYGLRGFVFADLFHSPLILLGSIGLLIGVITVALDHDKSVISKFTDITTYLPIIPWRDCALFVLATIFLNSFLVVTSESHWLRVWMFGKKVTSLQVRSLGGTAIIWTILILIGLFAGLVTDGLIGKDAVAKLISLVSDQSPLFVVAFWIAGTAVLFSTADTQIYAFLLTRNFNVRTGHLDEVLLNKMNPILMSFGIATLFTSIYFLIKFFDIPFEKLVFLLLPLSMICVPAFITATRGQRAKPIFLWISLILYSACAVLAIIQPADQFLFSISAPLMPALVSLLAVFPVRKTEDTML